MLQTIFKKSGLQQRILLFFNISQSYKTTSLTLLL
jgi:hypothetical protein